MANNFSSNGYSPTKTLSYLAIGCFSILIICFALYLIISVVSSITTLPMLTLNTGETVALDLVLIGLISLVEILVRLLTVVFFLIWLFKAFKNLSALESNSLEFTPGWAVGWWFIPFANLVKPYQIVSELWRESDTDFDPNTFLSNQIGSPAIIGWWWGLFIAGNIGGRISNSMIDGGSDYFQVVLVIASVLHGVSAFLIIQIIRSITKEQDLRFEKLGTTSKFQAPPSPPTFD